jgi:phosphoribosylformylglycinamidine synthase subunit PurQ / glutaminase
MKAAVITFPGSNCDRDAYVALQGMLSGQWGAQAGEVVKVWHRDAILPKVDVVMLPGGFSYGDYLRSGAMSARSPIMDAVKKHVSSGGYVIGVCNGFQILTEAGLLEGALMRNRDLRFICRTVHLKVDNNSTAFTKHYQEEQVIGIPVAHHDGNFRIDADGLKALQDHQQIIFRYCDEKGAVTEAANINGSVDNIAGISDKKGRVIGMMPHPERACDAITHSEAGRGVFTSLYASVA